MSRPVLSNIVAMKAADAIAALFDGAAMQSYLGEVVTLVDDMLQTAQLAEAARAPDGLIAAAAIAVRRWDDEAKDPTAVSPPVSHYRPLLEQLQTSR